MKKHQGIRIDKIPIGGVIGIVLVVGVALIFLFGVPSTRVLVSFALPVGILTGVGLYLWHNR